MFRFLLFLFLFIITSTAVGQSSQDTWLNALDDWHDGHYPQALNAFIELMEGPEADEWLAPVARQTGEWYRVTELSDDGTAVRFDESGRYAIWERPEEGLAYTWIHDLQTGERQRISGEELLVMDNGAVIFKRLAENEEVLRAEETREERVNRARQENDRALWMEALRDYERVIAANTRLMVRPAGEDRARDVTPDGFTAGEMILSPDRTTVFLTGQEEGSGWPDIYEWSPANGDLRNLTRSRSFESGLMSAGAGGYLLFEYAPRNPIDPRSEGEPQLAGEIGVLNLDDGSVRTLEGELEDVSDAGAMALLSREQEETTTLISVELGDLTEREIISTDFPITDPALSPEGTRVTYTIREQDDYEVFVHDANGANRRRVTRELQHDRFPTFLTEDRLIAAKGEGRHRRSFLYDLSTGESEKLFHNNTVRTIAPEYQWAVNSAGNRILIVAERDGDTISPERGVYLLDLNSTITREELLDRLNRNLANEEALREKGRRLFERIAADVEAVVDKASRHRVYNYENDLYKFDSKYITEPGNDMAGEYLYNTYASFGYEPEYQWFTPEGRNVYGGKTANVLARLEGTENPELVYVVSSHYDSSQRGPGADDNTSGTAALLEAARILKDHPQPYTIIFASFTGEEAGLLGSREFVRQAQEEGMQIVGALNNDMVGMANNSRLDNTIRYSNPGIRDIQHAAAFLFTDMVTYDALYYKSTDAHAYYEAYGDIVGGIGSYPVLGNPFYHQWNDNLETVNHQLVTEVAKTTAATLMLLASSPSRVGGLTAEASGTNGGFTVTWEPSPESSVREYLVRYEDPSEGSQTIRTGDTSISLPAVKAGSSVQVKAVSDGGQEGWDWASIEV